MTNEPVRRNDKPTDAEDAIWASFEQLRESINGLKTRLDRIERILREEGAWR